MAKEMTVIEVSQRFQDLFLAGSGGRFVLSRIINGPCRFFEICNNDETRIRQNVGREILGMCGLLQGKDPQRIIAQLCSRVEPEVMTLREFIKLKLRRKRR